MDLSYGLASSAFASRETGISVNVLTHQKANKHAYAGQRPSNAHIMSLPHGITFRSRRCWPHRRAGTCLGLSSSCRLRRHHRSLRRRPYRSSRGSPSLHNTRTTQHPCIHKLRARTDNLTFVSAEHAGRLALALHSLIACRSGHIPRGAIVASVLIETDARSLLRVGKRREAGSRGRTRVDYVGEACAHVGAWGQGRGRRCGGTRCA